MTGIQEKLLQCLQRNSAGVSGREAAFVRTFLIGDKEARECRHRIRDAVIESKVLSFQMIDFPAITNYISLIAQGNLSRRGWK